MGCRPLEFYPNETLPCVVLIVWEGLKTVITNYSPGFRSAHRLGPPRGEPQCRGGLPKTSSLHPPRAESRLAEAPRPTQRWGPGDYVHAPS